MNSIKVNAFIPFPETINHVVYSILQKEVLTGKLLQIDISERDGIWYVVRLNVNNGEALTCEFSDDDIGKSLFSNLHEAKLASQKLKR